MTMNTFYQMVAANDITDEVIAFAKAKADKASTKAQEKVEARAEIVSAVTQEPMTAQEIAGILGMSWQKVSSNLNYAFKTGEADLVKGENADGKRTWAIAGGEITESETETEDETEDEDEVPFDED